VIGNGHGIHAEIPDALQQTIDPDGTVQKAVLGMKMEVNEIGYCI
jgi:hypothetical protein